MVEYTEYREHIRRRRAWTWGPLSCVSSAAVSFSHVLVEHTDFPSMYTSWTDRDTLLSACTVHIVIFCIAVLWIILPKPVHTKTLLILVNLVPIMTLLTTPMLVEVFYDAPMLLAGPFIVGCGVTLFGASTGGNCSKAAVVVFTVMYVFWLFNRITPENQYDRLEVLVPSVVVASALLFCGLWLSFMDEKVEYECFLDEQYELALHTATEVEIESLDVIVESVLPKFIFKDLASLRASRFPAQPPDKITNVTTLSYCTADGTLPMSLTRLLGVQYDMRLARRCFVTMVVARVCDADIIFREGTLCQAGNVMPHCEKLFDILEKIGNEHSVHHIMYDKGAFIACAGLKSAVGYDCNEPLNHKALTAGEQRYIASFSLSAIEVAKKWSLEGSDSGLPLCVGVSSGYVTFGGVMKNPINLNVIGLPLIEATDLAMTNESNDILITPNTIKLARLAMGGANLPIQDMRVLHVRGRLTPIYIVKSDNCNISISPTFAGLSKSSSHETDLTQNPVTESMKLTPSNNLSVVKLNEIVGGGAGGLPISYNEPSDEVSPAPKNGMGQQKQQPLGVSSQLGTKVLGIVLRRLVPNLQCKPVDLAVRDLHNHLFFLQQKCLFKPWFFTPPARPVNFKQQILQSPAEEVNQTHQALVDNDSAFGRTNRFFTVILLTGLVTLYGISFPRGDDFEVTIYRGIVAVCCFWIVVWVFHKSTTRGKDKDGKMFQEISFLLPLKMGIGLLAIYLLCLGMVYCNDSYLLSMLMGIPWTVYVFPGYIWPQVVSLRLVLWAGLCVVWFLVVHLPQASTGMLQASSTTLFLHSMAVMLRWLSLVPALVLFWYTRLCILMRCQDSLDSKKSTEQFMTARLNQQMKESTRMALDMFPPRCWPLLAPHLPFPTPPLEGEVEMLESLPLAGAAALVLHNTWVIYIDAVSLRKLEGILEPNELTMVVNKVSHMLNASMSQQGAYSVSHNNGSHTFIVPGVEQTREDGEEEGVKRLKKGSLHTPQSRSDKEEAKKLRIEGLEICIKALQAMEREIWEFNRRYQMGLSVTVGLSVGDVRVGFIGGNCMSWDVLGHPVLQAWALASYPLSDRDAPVIRMEPESMQLIEEMADDPANGELLQWVSVSLMDGALKRNSLSMDVLLCKEIYHAFVSEPQYRIRRNPEIEDFQVLGLLGQGGSGKVYKAVDSCTGKTHAVKKLENASLFRGMSKWTRVELQILTRARHPNVVSFTGCLQSPQSVYLVMDYKEGLTLGSLLRCRDRNQSFGISTLRFWFGELAVALEYLHESGIIHRDVKADNIWISMDGHLQLMDFGLSKIVCPSDDSLDGEEVSPPVLNYPTMRMLPDASRQLLKGLWTVAEEEEDKDEYILGSSAAALSDTDTDVMHVNNDKTKNVPEQPPLMVDTANPLCMLITDPNLFHSVVIKTLMKQSGYTALTASSYRQARKVLITQRNLGINVLLVTWQQPGVQKFLADLGSYMRAERGITVIVTEKKNEKEAYDSGLADYCFTGPFTADHVRFLQERLTNLRQEKAPVIGENDVGHCDGRIAEEYYFTNRIEESRKKSWGQANGLYDHPGSSTDKSKNSGVHRHLVGTLHMMAPEVISDQIYSFAADWWNYGICLYESTTGLLPFVGNSLSEVYKNATKGPPNLTLVHDLMLRDFISKLLQVDPSTRLGSGKNGDKDVKEHFFFVGVDLDNLYKQCGPCNDPTVNLEIALARSASTCNEDDQMINFYPQGRLPVGDRMTNDTVISSNSVYSEPSSDTSANVSVDIFECIAENVSICSADTVNQQVLLD